MTRMRKDEGNALIEVALILPVLILLLLGTLDLVLVIQGAITVADTASQGAEYGAAKWEYSSDTTDMQGLAGYIGYYTVPNYTSVATISCSCGAGGSAIACNGMCSGGVAPAQYTQVTAKANIPLLFGVAGLPASFPLQSVARVRVSWKAGN